MKVLVTSLSALIVVSSTMSSAKASSLRGQQQNCGWGCESDCDCTDPGYHCLNDKNNYCHGKCVWNPFQVNMCPHRSCGWGCQSDCDCTTDGYYCSSNKHNPCNSKCVYDPFTYNNGMGNTCHMKAPTPAPTMPSKSKRFMTLIDMTTNATLHGNTDVVGIHLHTGAPPANGPINIIYCMGYPLPSSDNWPTCAMLMSETRTQNGEFKATFLAEHSVGAWDYGVNNATAVKGAMTMAQGAPTTEEEFMMALKKCTENYCDVYFNWHTVYSFNMNPGFGLGRAQLVRMSACPSTSVSGAAVCYGTRGMVTSENTNIVMGMKKMLPMDAGNADVLIVVPMTDAPVTITSGSMTKKL